MNGIKKWITNGLQAHYFTTAVRTSKGISLLLIERSEGVETKPVKTSYSASAGTSLVIFENVLVPVGNLLGRDGGGFQVIMYNFNHERLDCMLITRWYMIVGLVALCRKIVEECFKWSNQRKVFGKALIEQPGNRTLLNPSNPKQTCAYGL